MVSLHPEDAEHISEGVAKAEWKVQRTNEPTKIIVEALLERISTGDARNGDLWHTHRRQGGRPSGLPPTRGWRGPSAPHPDAC